MSDEAKEGGTDWELQQAEHAMIAAGHPDIALAMRRHAEAQRNMMQGVMVPMFATLVERVLDAKLQPLVDAEKETHSGIAALSAQFREMADDVAQLKKDGVQLKQDMRDSQQDRAAIHRELDVIRAQLTQLQQAADGTD